MASRTFRSLHNRNFRLFFIGQLVSNTGNWLTMVALVLLILHSTGSGFAVGLLTACQFGPILLLSAWAGSIADRSDKRKLLFFTQGGEMAQSCVLAALAFMHHPPIGALYGVALCGGVLLSFDNPLRRSFVTEMVQPDEVPNAVMLYSSLVNTSRVFGPTLAGLLVTTLGYGWCFTIDAASYVAVITALAMMRTAELRRRPVAARAKGQVRDGLRYVRSMPALWMSFVMLAVVGTLGYNFSVVFPLFVEQGLGGSDATYTFVYALFSVGALVGALAAANRAEASMRMIVVGCAAFGFAMVALTFVPNVWWAYPVVLVVGGSSIVYMTSTTAIVQVRARPSMHGRVLALQTVLLVGTTPIGGPLLGAISDRWGPRTPVAVGAAASLGAASWGWWAMRRHRADLALPDDPDPYEGDEVLLPLDPQPSDPRPT
jgi:MFS family permease